VRSTSIQEPILFQKKKIKGRCRKLITTGGHNPKLFQHELLPSGMVQQDIT
jgi:hypothetical protein